MSDSSPATTSQPDLLHTKLVPPRLPRTAIVRASLLAQLELDAERKVTQVIAPAGFGKTTLVNQWLRGNAAHLGQVAWLSLDEDDNEGERFWRYVIAAYQNIAPDKGGRALVRLNALPPMPFTPQPLNPAVALLLNDLATLEQPIVLVLDDYHLITDETIHQSLGFFLEHLPDRCHVVMMARHLPPLPLARLRAHGDLTELHAERLRFSRAETEQFLAAFLPTPMSAEAVTQLWERTEGWAVGLRLAVLALRNSQSPDAISPILGSFNGSQPAVAEYLIGDVLQAQSADIQDFLLQTSLLDTLTGALCDAMTGRNDSATLLAELAQRNFFLTPLEGERGWYRYHSLFLEALRHEAERRFGAEGLHPYYRRAGKWYEAQKMEAEAIEYALAATDWAHAITLLEPLVEGQHLTDPHDPHRIYKWLEQLPPALLRLHPLLCFSYAIVLIRTLGPRHPDSQRRGPDYIQLAEAGWRREGNHARLGEVYAANMLHAMWSGDMEKASHWAKEAVARLPVNDVVWRGLCLGFVGRAELRAGKLHAARRTLMEARAGSEFIQNNYATRAHMMMLANVGINQGELTHAEALYREALPSAEADGDWSDMAPAHWGLATIAYERDDLPRASEEAQFALKIATERNFVHWREGTDLLLAEIEQAQHNPQAARERLAAMLVRLSDQRHPDFYREALRVQARLALAHKDLETVRRWATTVHEIEAPLSQQAFEQETLLVVRLRLAEGNPIAALHLMEDMAERAYTDGRLRIALEVRLLRAFAYHLQGEPERATTLLREVLTQGYTMGLRRFFLDEGEPCATLLRAALPLLSDAAVRTYAQSLLQGFVVAQHETAAAPLLSPQEQRVLELLATGQSYQEMAQQLIVSVNTIKTQLRHIYRKLGATSRQEAIDLARRLDLLP